MHTTSVSLLERLRNLTDRCSWERFVKLYAPLLYHWSINAGVDGREVEDLVQEVLAIVVKELPGFRYDASRSFRGWLRTVLKNKWRELRRRPNRVTYTADSHDEVVEPDWITSLVEEEYRNRLIERALQVMKEDFDQMTWQACWEYVAMDRPANEVANELGISVNSVYLAKSRVLRRLRSELTGLLE